MGKKDNDAKKLNDELRYVLNSIPTKDLWIRSDEVRQINVALRGNNEHYKKSIIKKYKDGV